MKPDEIDRILDQAGQRDVQDDAERAAVDRVQRALLSDLRPVRPMAPLWAFVGMFTALSAGVAIAVAAALGFYGVHALAVPQRALIFPALLAAAWLAAAACARAMRPAAGARLGSKALLIAAMGFPVLFALVLRGYSTYGFVEEGIPCLINGRSTAGIAAGVLSGLTGLAMLELHCQNLKAIHVMFWHVAVVVVSGLAGFAIGRLGDRFRRRETI
jgi:hypothetical protein